MRYVNSYTHRLTYRCIDVYSNIQVKSDMYLERIVIGQGAIMRLSEIAASLLCWALGSVSALTPNLPLDCSNIIVGDKKYDLSALNKYNHT